MYLITCTGDNYHYTKIAEKHGYKIGAQLPVTVYASLFFGDQNWKNPRRQQYMQALAMYKPRMATVLDLERPEQLPEVMSWAEQASMFIEKVIIIPKYSGAISKLPREINGKQVVLGFSVPTKYAGTTVPTEEFSGWPVHLLGGNPFQQLTYSKKMGVVSVDCNFHLKMANIGCQFFSLVPKYTARNPDWPTLLEADGRKWEWNGRFEAFRRSCLSIQDFWRHHGFRVSL